MLRELRVENVGVIADLALTFGPGMTVLTGETGAGKTLIVEALELLVGARADAGLVRAGAEDARVEARFEVPDRILASLGDVEATSFFERGDDMVLARVVPASGRSRAYVNGRLVPVASLRELGARLVDLHGQHSHHSLLTAEAQRTALDRFGGEACVAALASYRTARQQVLSLQRELSALGGDDRARAREVDLLRFQVEEIDSAGIESADEDGRLLREEEALASARAIRDGAEVAYARLETDALDGLGVASEALSVPTLSDTQARVRALQDEVAEVARELRRIAENSEEDPARLEEVGARRRTLRDLRRKYGEKLSDVVAYRQEADARLSDLIGASERAGAIASELDAARGSARAAGAALTEARRTAATELGIAIAEEIHELGMPGARVEIAVDPTGSGTATDGPGDLPEAGLDAVEFRLSANPGEPLRPFARVASGGELARTMLAARVLLTEGAPTIVFDEVDAGIGGEAGAAVGRRLGLVAHHHQVLCVTHLAQVAAFADVQVVVEKGPDKGPEKGQETAEASPTGRTVASARVVDGDARVAELSRMLSGQATDSARRHAEELLARAAARQDHGA